MKKYKIKYQDKNEIKELILYSQNLSNEELPSNIIEIIEYKNYFDFQFLTTVYYDIGIKFVD